MRGHIKQRSKGSWTLWLELGRDPETGKRKQKTITINGNKREAERKLAEIINQMDNGIFATPNKIKLSEFLAHWLKTYAYPNLSPRTAEGYEYMIRKHLIPSLGNILLTKLNTEHLQKYYADKLENGRCDGKGGLSPKTVRHHHITLHTTLQSAIKWGYLGRNPVDAVDAPRFQSPEINTMDESQIKNLLEAAKSTEYYALFYMAIFTGMRRSELLALRWNDVDLDLAQVYVNRSIQQLKTGAMIYRAPKTARGRRMIALSPSAASMLREHKAQQESIFYMSGAIPNGEDLIFCHPNGRPFRPDTVTHAWLKLARRTGLRGIRLHDARHSHASLLLKQGIHPKVVQERLGHASIQTTLDIYSHVAPGLQEAAALRFEEVLGNYGDVASLS